MEERMKKMYITYDDGCDNIGEVRTSIKDVKDDIDELIAWDDGNGELYIMELVPILKVKKSSIVYEKITNKKKK